jgi:asparagine synthase (glutamine-hydrolysing)
MCGIAGMILAPPGVVDAATIHNMCQTIIHRGPDDEGIYAEAGVGLGMRRLSIIDLSGGRQPVHNEDKTVWVVFNGEIYNFPEQRKELERSGHHFYTNSDTEVIVHLYEMYGADCVQKLRGMFALAVYDERSKRLLLARDRLGKKPLHYAFDGSRLLFGSEIKALLAVAPELAEVDREALLGYFYFGYIPDPATAFRGIRKLPPGHLLEFADGKVSVRQYWDLPAFGTAEPKSEEEYLEEMERHLAEAVRIRLISDVPLGAFLSGGVDSSTVVALMARASSEPVKTFTIGFAPEDFNEARAARLVSQRFNTEHHELVVEPKIGETLQKLSSSLEEPFADSSILPTYYVSCMTRKYVTVALAGDGGDELFGGYDRYAINLRGQGFDRVPSWVGKYYRESIFPWVPAGFHGRRFLFNATLGDRDRYLDSISFLSVFGRERCIFSKDFLAEADTLASPLLAFQGYFDDAPAKDLVSRLLYLDAKTYLPFDILTKVDRMSMATSLEVRAPILDHVFVEWATRLPSDMKFRQGQGKYLLKKLAARVGVPREVLDRPKQGFALPLVHWMRGELKKELLAILVEPRTLQRGYFDAQAVRDLLDEHWRGRRDRSSEIWMLLMFELWHRNFLEAGAVERSSVLGRPSPTMLTTASTSQRPEKRETAIFRSAEQGRKL